MTFDPTVVSYREILEVFFAIHDPTTLNRQGQDAGTQYRSAVFFHSPEQQATAESVMVELTKEEMQLSFFKLDDPLLEEIRDEILQTDIDTLTPVEALMKLNEIKRMLQRSTSVKFKK